jgi:glycosyltransferase involved in cell wall biosynthesis
VIEALTHVVKGGHRIKFINTTSRDRTSDTREYDALLRRIARLGLSEHVVATGYIQHNQIWHVYRNADVFVFPSFTESFGHPLVEAMASGLPVVASDIAVNRELCQDAASYFDVFDPHDCATAVAKILDSQKLRAALSQCARTRAQMFSWRVYAERLLTLFKELAGRG